MFRKVWGMLTKSASQRAWDECPWELQIALMGYCRAADKEGHSEKRIQEDLVRILTDLQS